MFEWDTDEYQAARRAAYEAIQSYHPAIVTKGFSCHAGWLPILEDFFAVVRQAIPVGREDAFDLRQVKEKFGGLRIYYGLDDGLPEAARADIHNAYGNAAGRAAVTCEVCGQSGVLRIHLLDGAWLLTRCEEHADGGMPVPTEDAE